jgi:hypothetical protein
MGQPTIEERLSPEVSFMEYGGVAYSGTTTGTFAALIGSAPGTTPDFHGSVENHEGLALLGQSQLNAMVGHLFANANSPFPTVSMDLSINAANLDIAPQETVGLHIAREDTVRNLAIDGLYIPDSMSWSYTPEGFMLLTSIDFKQLVNGIVGETVVIPITPDENIGGGFNQPGLRVPTIPGFNVPAFGFGSGVTDYIAMGIDTQVHQTWVTNGSNFDEILDVKGSAIEWDSVSANQLNILVPGWYLITISCRLNITLTQAATTFICYGGAFRTTSGDALIVSLQCGQVLHKPTVGSMPMGYSASLQLYINQSTKWVMGNGVSTNFAGGDITNGRVSITKLST